MGGRARDAETKDDVEWLGRCITKERNDPGSAGALLRRRISCHRRISKNARLIRQRYAQYAVLWGDKNAAGDLLKQITSSILVFCS